MSKITVIIKEPETDSSYAQTITMEGELNYLPRALEFLELQLKCMGFVLDGKKLELLSTEEEESKDDC
jgi:hypothetical protein